MLVPSVAQFIQTTPQLILSHFLQHWVVAHQTGEEILMTLIQISKNISKRLSFNQYGKGSDGKESKFILAQDGATVPDSE